MNFENKKFIGKYEFHRNKNELKNLKFRRSIYAIKDIKKMKNLVKKILKL